MYAPRRPSSSARVGVTTSGTNISAIKRQNLRMTPISMRRNPAHSARQVGSGGRLPKYRISIRTAETTPPGGARVCRKSTVACAVSVQQRCRISSLAARSGGNPRCAVLEDWVGSRSRKPVRNGFPGFCFPSLGHPGHNLRAQRGLRRSRRETRVWRVRASWRKLGGHAGHSPRTTSSEGTPMDSEGGLISRYTESLGGCRCG